MAFKKEPIDSKQPGNRSTFYHSPKRFINPYSPFIIFTTYRKLFMKLTLSPKTQFTHKIKVNVGYHYLRNSIFKVAFKKVELLANEKLIF